MYLMNTFTASGGLMVKVITIMDDVYAELYRLKKSRGMSFSEVLRYMLKERSREEKNIISLAGSLGSEDFDKRAAEKIKKDSYAWGF
jgi:predicted CopG family antitoxin